MKQNNKYKVQQESDNRWLVSFKSKRGEQVTVEFERIITPEKRSKNDLMAQWVAHGFLPAILPTRWHISTWAYDKDGNCFGWYNPTIKEQFYKDWNHDRQEYELNSRNVINFDWMLEATEQNAQKIFAEVLRMANDGIKIIQDKTAIE